MSVAIKAGRMTSQGGMSGRVQAGDPGLFGAIGGALKGAVGGLFGGNPLTGAIGGAIRGFSNNGGGGPQVQLPVPSSFPGAQPVPGIGGGLSRLLPGGKTGYEVPAKASMGGYHLNRSSYFLRDGTFVAEGTKWVKNRRRNSLNPRALSRALSRVTGAKKAAKTLSRVTIRKKC